jgi:hypothetical protein
MDVARPTIASNTTNSKRRNGHGSRQVRSLAAGLRSFNLDLIYGGAGETVTDWERTVDAAVALDPPHVSAYALTVEAGTPLAADEARHPDDDDQADKYLLAEERLSAAGLDVLIDGDEALVDNAGFDSPAEAAGLEFDQKIVAVKEPVYQPPKELMYIPALAVLGLIIFMQRGRQRRQLATAAA